MDRSDVAKFVAVLASMLSLINIEFTPAQFELIVQIALAVVTIVPLAYAMLGKNPKTGKQEELKKDKEIPYVPPQA